MSYSDRFVAELEGKRKNAAAAVGAYIALLRDGRKLVDPKTDVREKIDTILPPIVKFDEILKICKM